MSNPSIGTVRCPFSGSTAQVRKSAKNKLYFLCPSCGLVQPTLQPFQEWMLTHAKMHGPDGAPEPEPVAPPPKPAAPPAPVAAPKPSPPAPKTPAPAKAAQSAPARSFFDFDL